MKNNILISDYDGTLKTTEKTLKKNIEAINNFMLNNNFVLSTGRPFYSIIKEIEKYNIKYDYLTCQDGSLIFNNKNELIFSDYLNNQDKKDLIYLLNKLSEVENYIINGSKCINKDHEDYAIEFEVTLKNKKNNKNFIELLKKVKENLSIYDIYGNIYIKNSINKSDGIKKLLEIQNLNPSNIYTIGDGSNDKEMLLDFNGYKMLKSNHTLYKEKIKTITSVYKLIEKIGD